MPCKPCICCSKRPEINAVTITFRVLDNDGCPICGALFRLECDCECCMYIHALSNKNGCVSFSNVCPGTYNLEQLASGCGYEFEPNDEPYVVVVSRSGSIRVDDRVINCFTVYNTKCGDDPNTPTAPDRPCINFVAADDVTISGTGEPCCTVEVTFPRCKCCSTVTNRDGTWSIDVPCGIILEDGDVICAELCCDCRPRSEETRIIVGEEPDPCPDEEEPEPDPDPDPDPDPEP